MRTTYVFRDGKWVDAREAQMLAARSRLHIITDEIAPLEHPCTGEIVTSKSKFRQITKAHGCVEVGTETNWAKPPGVNEEAILRDVRETYERLDAERK